VPFIFLVLIANYQKREALPILGNSCTCTCKY
jgi:hypothetical protein